MKTNQKINSVIAKALASKIYEQVKKKISEKEKEWKNNKQEEILQDPDFEKWVEACLQSKKLELKIEKKHKCSLYSDSIEDYSNGCVFRIPPLTRRKAIYSTESLPNSKCPSLEENKNDLLLMSWSQDEDLSSEQLIAKLIKKYEK